MQEEAANSKNAKPLASLFGNIQR